MMIKAEPVRIKDIFWVPNREQKSLSRLILMFPPRTSGNQRLRGKSFVPQ